MDNAEAYKMLGITHLHWGRRKDSTYLVERLTDMKGESLMKSSLLRLVLYHCTL